MSSDEMPAQQELHEALFRFRKGVIDALTDLDVEIAALQYAVEEPRPVSASRLKQLRENAQKDRHRFQDVWARRIPLANELR